MTASNYDFAIVGGGIVGLATAYTLQSMVPGARVVIIEKEPRLAQHQTGRNSGVIHAGVYYEPGSLKARLCQEGLNATLSFCRDHDIPFAQCGKLIVATDELELTRLKTLASRAAANGVVTEWLDDVALRAREPQVRGLAALFVSATGMVDYAEVALKLAERIRAAGGEFRLSATVVGLHENSDDVVITTSAGRITATKIIVCAGLYGDRLAKLVGLTLDFSIVPFRGAYFRLPDSRRDLINHHIYPVPDPALPFLGIHLTRLIDGGISVGPSAMLAFAREGYGLTTINGRDVGEMLLNPALWRVLACHWRAELTELRCALSPGYYLREVQKFCPQLTRADLLPYRAGVRAQALSRDGKLIHDFVIRRTPHTVFVCNAPSPAATAALPIAREIVAQALGALG